MTRALEIVFLVSVTGAAVWQEIQWWRAQRRSDRLRERLSAWL